MTQRRILMVQENIQTARYTRFLLEEAGYLVDWRPAITPALLRSERRSDAVLFDFQFLDREELAAYQLMREHPRWRAVPSVVAANIFHRQTRLRLRALGADEVVSKPFAAQELLMRLESLFRIAPTHSVAQDETPRRLGTVRDLAEYAAAHTSPEAVEAIMVQLLRSLRREVGFDVGYVCAEGAPQRYSVVAHVGDATCNNARWYEPGMSYTGWIAQHKRPLIVPDIDQEPRVRMFGRDVGGNRKFHSFLGVPLMERETVIGTMEVAFYRPSGPNRPNLQALEIAGKIASLALSNGQARRELTLQVGRGSRARDEEMEILPLVCQSSAMQEVLRVAARVRDSRVPILLSGETGTGKGLLAHYLHQGSSRRQQPFIEVSCATIPEAFQSQELFGIEAGFAPGIEAHAGFFEQCGGGTLFLDDVSHMPRSLQSKLLRVLEERRFSRIGSHEVQHFSGSVVSATSSNLQESMATGQFLPELYHRLALVELQVPALRARTADIPALAQYFNERFRFEQKLPMKELPARLLERLVGQQWPGNVRELKNAVERCILLFDGEDSLVDGEETHSPVAENDMLAEAMKKEWSAPELQLRYARYVYQEAGQNKARACRLLKINYRTLSNYLNKAL